MRRIKILFFWLFVNKNNVGAIELLKFLVKPTISMTAKKYVVSVKEEKDYVVSFRNIPYKMFWPKTFSLDRLNQVISETFDTQDWHYYQKRHTEIEPGERLLDIGTAEGLFSLAVIDKCDHVYLVEPSRLFTECLCKTFAPFEKKVTLMQAAVGNEDGEISFDENDLEGKVNKAGNEHKVMLRKIDTLIADKPVTYLKADIEGFELEMLKGAEQVIRKNKPKIAITTYHEENDPKEIIDLIKNYVPEYNYYVKGIDEKAPKPVLIHFWL